MREKTETEATVSREGAAGGAGPVGEGPAAGGTVTSTQIAGVWSGGSGGEDASSFPPLVHASTPRQQSPAVSVRNLATKKTRRGSSCRMLLRQLSQMLLFVATVTAAAVAAAGETYINTDAAAGET